MRRHCQLAVGGGILCRHAHSLLEQLSNSYSNAFAALSVRRLSANSPVHSTEETMIKASSPEKPRLVSWPAVCYWVQSLSKRRCRRSRFVLTRRFVAARVNLSNDVFRVESDHCSGTFNNGTWRITQYSDTCWVETARYHPKPAERRHTAATV